MIRVAVADDSRFICRLLGSHLESSGQCTVVGVAHDAESTLALVRAERPDVLTLDLEMPGSSGLNLLERLTTECPTRVVVISGVSKRAAATTLRALHLGAVDFVFKYTAGVPTNPDALRREILAKVTSAAQAVLIADRDEPSGHAERPAQGLTSTTPRPLPRPAEDRNACAGLVVIGASTGGPTAVREVLAELPADFPYAVLIVQHLPASFTSHFADSLAEHIAMSVAEASPAQRLEPGRALVAPGGVNTIVHRAGTVHIRAASDDDLYRPSIDVAMRTAAEVFGGDTTGVVLTGMGDDGAVGLSSIRAAGGRAYVQTLETCVVGGMPSRALETAGADYVGSPSEIGRVLARRGRVA